MDMINNMDASMVAELRESIKDCTERGLASAAKWSSELLCSIPASSRLVAPPPRSPEASTFSTSTPARNMASHSPLSFRNLPGTPAHRSGNNTRVAELDLENQEQDAIVNARAFFQSREFSRVVHTLKECISPKAKFISVYSRFLASEKKALKDWHKLDSERTQTPVPINPDILEMLQSVQNVTDPFLLFLKALFLLRLSRREEAIESAITSIQKYPWNWSTWCILGKCIGDGDELSAMLPLIPLLPTHPLVSMFQVRTLNELHGPSDAEVTLCDRLLTDQFFPTSLWLMSMRACVLYHLHDFGQAEIQFDKILEIDPFRIDDIDIFSNILYVTDNRLKLSRLAHDFLALDKDRPEVCCLVGNHYSIRSEHEKAVKYFKRATQLDQTYLSAWTLMGHEYVEMKNSHAAIEAYRRAVDVNRKDYRAWYGLGQAYELLNMQQYALHYYQHATALKPYDVRLWQAQAMCYEEIERPREAIECLKRALIGADAHETNINLRLAELYNGLGEEAEAMTYHRRVVEICRLTGRPIQDYSKSCLYVGWHMAKLGGDLKVAEEYLERVASANVEEVAAATEMLKRLRMIMQDKAVAGKT